MWLFLHVVEFLYVNSQYPIFVTQDIIWLNDRKGDISAKAIIFQIWQNQEKYEYPKVIGVMGLA